MNARDEKGKSHVGPIPLRVARPVVAWQEDGEEAESTFRLDGNRLVVPAFGRTDHRTWEFRSTSTRGVFECAVDPFQDPWDRAEFPSAAAEGQERRYAMEDVADPEHPGGLMKVLRFFVRMPDGTDHDECRLIWDSHGAQRFEGSSWYHDFEEVIYEPIDEAEWQSDLGLPDIEPR